MRWGMIARCRASSFFLSPSYKSTYKSQGMRVLGDEGEQAGALGSQVPLLIPLS